MEMNAIFRRISGNLLVMFPGIRIQNVFTLDCYVQFNSTHATNLFRFHVHSEHLKIKYNISILIATFFISNNYCFATFYWPKLFKRFFLNLAKYENHHSNAYPSISCWVPTETKAKKFSKRKYNDCKKRRPANDITFVASERFFRDCI